LFSSTKNKWIFTLNAYNAFIFHSSPIICFLAPFLF
jgi:hypothetical protein